MLAVLASGLLAASSPGTMTEDEALSLVLRAARQLYQSEDARCFSAMTEGRTPTAFDIAVRENHKPGCGGDPSVEPVRDRFRVEQAGNLSIYDPADDVYVPCRVEDRRPICPTP